MLAFARAIAAALLVEVPAVSIPVGGVAEASAAAAAPGKEAELAALPVAETAALSVQAHAQAAAVNERSIKTPKRRRNVR